jgi:RNA polymerase sigma-70 factor, ECF subfamily
VLNAKIRSVAYERCDDAELASCACRQDADAFREIMRRHNRRLYRVARAILKDETEAEDVVQETFVRAFAALGSFRGESSLATWLTRISLNEAYASLRRRRPNVEFDVVDREPNSAEIIMLRANGQNADPEKAAAQAQIRKLIESAIDTLPEHFRIVFVMRDVEEFSVEDTARLLELQPETVKTRLHRARRRLRDTLHMRLSTMLSDAFPFAGARCTRISNAVLARMAAERPISSQVDIEPSSP